MSFKYSAQRVDSGHFILPKTKDMKVDAHVLMSDALYEASEEESWKQLADAASFEGVVGAFLMPDAHAGFGVPVGSVLVTEGTIIPASVGYDLSCGMLLMQTDVGISALKGRYSRERFISEFEKRVQTGIGSRRPEKAPKVSGKDVDRSFFEGAKIFGTSADVCERLFLPVNSSFVPIEKALEKAVPQFGSLGSGNHFCELLADEKDGTVWAMIHTGSRGFGYQTAEHFFYEAARLRGMQSKHRSRAWLYADEPLGKEYLNHHNAAANYAIANRHAIAVVIKEILWEMFSAESSVFYEISHNLIQQETLVSPDGTTKRRFVHRKGSTRAMPAGHPDIVGTAWADVGHPIVVPGSMFSGAAVLTPLGKAHDWACSVNHGSGRVLARGVAKRKLEHKQLRIDEEMHDVSRTFGGTTVEGIVCNSKHVPLDECAHVYKSLDEVLSTLEEANVAKVERRLYPLLNIKGVD